MFENLIFTELSCNDQCSKSPSHSTPEKFQGHSETLLFVVVHAKYKISRFLKSIFGKDEIAMWTVSLALKPD